MAITINKSTDEGGNQSNSDRYFIDITKDICPMTFVRTKLVLERMPSGHLLEVRLKGAEPLRNVPQNASDSGHVVVSLVPEKGEPEAGIHRLILRKN